MDVGLSYVFFLWAQRQKSGIVFKCLQHTGLDLNQTGNEPGCLVRLDSFQILSIEYLGSRMTCACSYWSF